MDITISNLEPKAYRALKAKAALLGITVDEAVNAAITAYLAHPASRPRNGSLRDLVPEAYPPENDRISEEIDALVHGPNARK